MSCVLNSLHCERTDASPMSTVSEGLADSARVDCTSPTSASASSPSPLLSQGETSKATISLPPAQPKVPSHARTAPSSMAVGAILAGGTPSAITCFTSAAKLLFFSMRPTRTQTRVLLFLSSTAIPLSSLRVRFGPTSGRMIQYGHD